MKEESVVCMAAPKTEAEAREFFYREALRYEAACGWLMLYEVFNHPSSSLIALALVFLLSTGSYLWFETTTYGLIVVSILIISALTLISIARKKGKGAALWHSSAPTVLKKLNDIPFADIVREYPRAFCEKQELKRRTAAGEEVLAEIIWLILPQENGSVIRRAWTRPS